MGDDGSAWEELASAGRVRRFRRGERIVLDGARSGTVMYLRAGSVRIVASTPEGDEVTLAVRHTGDLVGDHSALTGGRTDAAVIGLQPGEAALVATDRYLEVLGRHPELLIDQARRLVQRLQESDQRLVELSTLPVETRVLRQLRRLADRSSAGTEVPLSQEELAAMCGASRGAVAEVLGRLREQGLLDTGRRRITVLDADGLAALVD